MPISISMPRLSDTMEEGTLLSWKVSVGDEVSSGDHLADVETDKATMELQAFDDGKVAKILCDEGNTVPIETPILVLAEEDESVEDAAANAETSGTQQSTSSESSQSSESSGSSPSSDTQGAQSSAGSSQTQTQTQAQSSVPGSSQSTPSTESGGGGMGDGEGGGGKASGRRLRISPLARRMADENNLDPQQITGTGPDGRIIKRDVLNAVESGSAAAGSQAGPSGQVAQPSGPAAPQPPAAGAELESKTIQLSNMRKTIAKRLVESKTTIPHFEVSVQINMDPLMDLRKTLNNQLASQGIKLSVNDFIIRGSALAATQHPQVNASWSDQSIVQHGTVNIGVAISLPAQRGGGLVVATIRDAHQKGLRQLSTEVRQLADKARNRGLSPEEMSESTLTVSNLGMPQYGVTQFNAVINPPNAAIVATAAAIKQPVVREVDGQDQIVIGHQMMATLAGDHRVIDGAIAAEYLATFRQMLENPAGLLV